MHKILMLLSLLLLTACTHLPMRSTCNTLGNEYRSECTLMRIENSLQKIEKNSK